MLPKLSRLTLLLFFLITFPAFCYSQTQTPTPSKHKIQTLVGESLKYDVSFLWFNHLAEGSIDLSLGTEPNTFLVIMQAKTLGLAAFFTDDRVAKYQTLMKIGNDGLLQPIWHSSHTIRGKNKSIREKITKLTFDYAAGKVRYQRIKNGLVSDDKLYEIEKEKPLLDILSATYNLRLGFYGKLGQEKILIPTFHRKGTQEIVVEPFSTSIKKDKEFFSGDIATCRVLVDPSVFGTDGRETLASFDHNMRPHKVIIKNVIGLGDLKIKPQ